MEGGDGSDAPAAGRPGEAEGPKEDDILLLAEEKFDFDLSVSSLSASEDDEVFFGPVGHKERCVAASLELSSQSPAASHFRWSPLTGEKFVEVYKEAHLLAFQIESRQTARAARPGDVGSQGGEAFIQDSELKVNLFEKEKKTKKSPNSLKRETYHLSDSPLTGPQLPGTQPASDVGPQRAAARADLTRAQGPPLPSRPSLPVEPSPVHPANQAATQRKVSKLLPPRASARGKSAPLAMEKSTKEKPASPSRMQTLTAKESHRDRAPGTPSAAKDVGHAPARGRLLGQGKRSLPVPNKLALKKTAVKPPGCAGSLMRKPGAWGGVSGGSSSASPTASTAKSSARPSISADSPRPPANPSQPGPAGATVAWPSLQAGPAAAAATTSALTQPQTPEPGGPRLNSQSRLSLSSSRSSSRSSQLDALGASRRDSLLHCKTKVMPTPASQFKIPKFPAGETPDSATPRFPRAQRPQSCASAGRAVHGTLARGASGPVSGTPVNAKRTTALPTPASRRLSGLPALTPRALPGTLASALCGSARRLPSEPGRRSAARTALVSRCSDESSDGSVSPPAALPQALSFSPEKSDLPCPTSIAAAQAVDEAQPPGETSLVEALLVDIPLGQLCIAPAAGSSLLVDAPLIDLCSPPGAGAPSGSAGRPLIDLLVNTPDMDRNAAAKPPHDVGQLIDLCSPLIQLSPEANKENVDSPLLKF